LHPLCLRQSSKSLDEANRISAIRVASRHLQRRPHSTTTLDDEAMHRAVLRHAVGEATVPAAFVEKTIDEGWSVRGASHDTSSDTAAAREGTEPGS
jgi:hypothetical protein